MSKVDYQFVSKRWGFEKIFCNGLYCGKLLFIAKEQKISWHYHKLKDEHFAVQSGEAIIYYSNYDDLDKAEWMILRPGDCFHVPVGLRHRIYAILDTYIYEFSTNHQDSDSIRLKTD